MFIQIRHKPPLNFPKVPIPMASQEDDLPLSSLESACSDVRSLVQESMKMEESLEKMDKRFILIDESLSTTSRRIAPLHSLAITTKALETRINRAITPALSLLNTFQLSESLQSKILEISSELSAAQKPKQRLKLLLKYVDCVDKLNAAITTISQDGEPVIQKLQEVVEFLSRTKATDQYRTHRLKEALVTLKALFETEVDSMKFDGLLDEALLNLQDEYESLLQQLRHQNIGDSQGEDEADQIANSDLGTEQEIELLRRISETLASNDCLDICINIFVKVRYRRAAKALMRLNPDYLRTYTPEEIDEMEWESLETSISLWIQHFELAVKTVFESERKLSNRILGEVMEGAVWLECFVKIADKIMAVFFRFGEGVARSSKEPQKLFKLLDMFDSLQKLKTQFSDIFEGEAGADICTRYRELEKLLVHASSKVFWEFGLKIEGNSDGLPPPEDGSVPKLVRYAINYLKYLATENYRTSLGKVLRTEHVWKAGILSKPETEENLIKEAITNTMEAIKRNIESKRSRYKDKILTHVFAMNTYWYIYMRTRSTELGKLLGEQYVKDKYKVVAEESAYMYQKQAWGGLARLLEIKEDVNTKKGIKNAEIADSVRGKMESFLKGFEEIVQRHRGSFYVIPDTDLREQIGEATVKLLIPAYTKLLKTYESVVELEAGDESGVSPEIIKGLLAQTFFSGGDRVSHRRFKRRDSKDRTSAASSLSVDGEIKEVRRSRSISDT